MSGWLDGNRQVGAARCVIRSASSGSWPRRPQLGARRGFHAISMAEIGSEAGIVGSGIYRHFGSKTAILVSMSDQVMDRLADGAATILALATSLR